MDTGCQTISERQIPQQIARLHGLHDSLKSAIERLSQRTQSIRTICPAVPTPLEERDNRPTNDTDFTTVLKDLSNKFEKAICDIDTITDTIEL